MAHSINLGDILARNSSALAPYNITAQMRHWKDSVVDIGGFYQASGQYWLGAQDDLVGKAEAEQFFLTRLGSHIVRADAGGSPQWEGYISEMELTADGITQTRSTADIITKLRVAYTRYTGNYLMNGSVENGTIDNNDIDVDAVPTVTRFNAVSEGIKPDWSFDTTWATHGVRSIQVDMRATEEFEGGGIKFWSGVAVVQGAKYCVRADVKISINVYPCNLYISVFGGTDELKDWIISSTVETINFVGMFDAPSTATGNLSVWVHTRFSEAGSDGVVFNADNFQIYQAGTPATTDWTEDTAATALWGLHEESIICKPMTDGEALQRRNLSIVELAYPRTKIINVAGQSDGLRVMCEGYIFKTFSASTTLGGVKPCSTHITNLLSGNAFITVGYVTTNTFECYIDETQPINVWSALQDVIEVGAAGNVSMIGGVYAGRKFIYEPRPTTANVKFKGRWLNMDNSPMNPQTARPCIAYMEDMTGNVGDFTRLLDNPRYVYIPSWEFDGDTETATPTEVKGML